MRDQEFRGYCVRIRESGRKSFCYEFRWAGKPDKITFGEFPVIGVTDGRKLAMKAALQVQDGINPRLAQQAGKAAAIAAMASAKAAKGDMVENVVSTFLKQYSSVGTAPAQSRNARGSWPGSSKLGRDAGYLTFLGRMLIGCLIDLRGAWAFGCPFSAGMGRQAGIVGRRTRDRNR